MDGNKYTDPQPDRMQRELGTISLKRDVFIRSLPLGLREPWRRGGRKHGRARGDGEHQESKAF